MKIFLPHSLILLLLLLPGCAQRQPIQFQIQANYTVHDPQFMTTMAGLLCAAPEGGNEIRTYSNGDEIFPAMLDAIAGAKKTITFEIYSYEKGNIGKTFADAFAARARAGVRVHILADAVGAATMESSWATQMQAAGVQFHVYHPFKPFDPASYPKMEHRTHRKLLVIDGQVGFIGGVGIGDEWTGHAQDSDHWRDNCYRVTGPAVSQLQAAFAENWIDTTGIVLQGGDYFPALAATQGGVTAQVFRNSSGSGGSQTMQLLFLLSIAAAGEHVRLETPYFVPDGQTTQYFLDARKRGVMIEVIVPGKYIDVSMVRDASRAKWGKLLEAGVAIYEFQPTMIHSKLMIVDDIWTSVGSSNLDNRSFGLNSEANLNVYDKRFAAQQIQLFEADKSRSLRITYDEWKHRPWPEKMQNALARPISPEL